MKRKEAIQVLQTALTAPFVYGNYAEAIGMAIEALQQERPRGEWIDNGDNWLCSNCNVESYVDEDYRPEDKRAMQMNYCHYCGAIMIKGGGNE